MSASITKREILFLIVLLLVTLVYRRPTVSPAPVPPDADELINRGTTFIGIEPHDENRIRKELRHLVTPRCGEAFKVAHLQSPRELFMTTGVVFYPSELLYLYPARDLGLISERTRIEYKKEFSTGRVQAATVSAKLYGVARTLDGRPRFFIHETAFLGESLIFDRLSLSDVLAHEFIHAGGQPPTPGWFFQDDLGGFKDYDKIMEACK